MAESNTQRFLLKNPEVAETNLVESELQYNLAKLALARSAGVIELQYKHYLGN